jgi:hypothetical protein
MEDLSLEVLLSRILCPDNVLRAAAEKELERRSSTVSGFCEALAVYCEGILTDVKQRALAFVSFSVLRRTLATSIHYQDLHQVALRFLSHLNDVAVVPEMSASLLSQWTTVVCTCVRRLATLRASLAAVQEDDTASVEASLDSVCHAVISQLLHTFAQSAQSDPAGLRIVCSHVWLLQTFFEEPVGEATQGWCAELMASCAAPLLEMLCALVNASHMTASASSRDERQMRCALQATIAQTLGVMYEWQFAATRRGRFPADLKQVFLAAFTSLQACVIVPCVQWASSFSDSATSAGNDLTRLSAALSRSASLIAAALATQELVVKVLQYGGWYKRCATPELLRGLLNSLEADSVSYQVATMFMEGNDAVDGGFAAAGPSGTRADGWNTISDKEASEGMQAEAALLVRGHVTQRWTLFRDISFLPALHRCFIDVVGDQCGRHYYELLLSYAVLTPSEACELLECPNVFLREEEERDDGVRWTVRELVVRLYTDSIPTLGPLFVRATLECLNERLFEEGESAASAASVAAHGRLDAALQREAALLFMEMALRHRSKNLRECGVADFAPLAAHVWAHDVAGPTAHPKTTARAVMLLIAIVEFSCGFARKDAATAAAAGSAPVPPPSSRQLGAFIADAVGTSAAVLAGFVEGAASPELASRAPSCSLLVAVVLCRFLHSTLPYWPLPVLEQHFASFQSSLLGLLSPQVGLTEEVLYATVEQLADLIHAAQRAVEKNGCRSTAGPVSLVLDRLPTVVMNCWRRHAGDPSFADVVLQLLCRVERASSSSSNSSGGAALSQLLQELSWVNSVLCGYADSMAEVCAVPYFLRLLQKIFSHAPDEVANGAATLMLDSLCQLLLCTEESAILVASSSCLAALLRRCPAAQSVQVHVIAASMEAAITGKSSSSADVSIAHAPRTAYPFSAVIVAIVLRTLQDDRDEASLLEMGQMLVVIMRQSTSFSEADLLRVIHATVHRLSVVRTDSVKQQLLAPLATLLVLHPVALLRTLVQGGLLASTMEHWLPRVEHFTSLSVCYSSCEGLLELLQLLSEPARAFMAAEEGQQIAQLTVACRWKLPADVVDNASFSAATGALKAIRRGGRKSVKAGTPYSTLTSALADGEAVETSLPLYAAVLVAVGRGVLTLLHATLPALRRARQPDGVDLTDDMDAISTSDSEGQGGKRLFQENSSDDDDEDRESWTEEVDDFKEGEDKDDGAGGVNALLSSAARDDDDTPGVSNNPATVNEKAEKEGIVAAMGSQLLPWMQKYGTVVSPYFSMEETQLLMSFFASAAGSTAE